MIDSYTFNPKDILLLEYLSISEMEEVSVPTLLRDFGLISTHEKKLEGLAIKLNIYVKTTGEKVQRLYMDSEYKGPPCFGCGNRGNVFFDELAREREQNISEHYTTRFLIPFDPEVPLVWFDKLDGCFKLSKPTEEQQIQIFKGYIERIRRL